MLKKLQNIIFPTDEKLQAHWDLYYSGPRCVVDENSNRLWLPAGVAVGFATYLNGFSLEKWKRYTPLQSVELRITLQGKCCVQLVGYSLNPSLPERREILRKDCDFAQPQELCLPYPDESKDQMLAFELLPYENCMLYGGAFYGEYQPEAERQVVLSLATTTCRKEEFITHNVQLLKQELLCEGSDLRDNLYVHVVDNGRTLDPKSMNGYHVTVHPNKNTGGSGGYARGMIESLHQTPKATHVLLMDDDVLVLPESIRRTYVLLTLSKPEYYDSFVSGAMLEYGAMNMQHEDVGTVTTGGDWRPARERRDQTKLANVLKTDMEILPMDCPYAGWWYCCIPVESIEKNGLPLPLFIRCDDLEYSQRCKPAHFLTMTGICIWHMGFGYKYNVSMDHYQRFRNMLIARATTNTFTVMDIMARLRMEYRSQMLEFAYNGSEIILRALEDYMKGPEFIMEDQGEKILKENSKLNERMKPIESFGMEVRIEDVYRNPTRKLLDTLLYRLTYNGHRFWPKAWLKKQPGIIGGDTSYQPEQQVLRQKLLAVNVYDRTANLRVQDRKRYRTIQKRYRMDLLKYALNHKKIEARYAAARNYLTSEKFWRKYLEL